MRDNLILRGHTYHVRLAIPDDVRDFFGGRKLLSQSLKTGIKQEARDKARPILLDWKNQIIQARSSKASHGDIWRQAAYDEGVGIQNDRKEVIARIFTPPTSTINPDLSGWLDDAKELYDDLIHAGHPSLADRILLAAKNFRAKTVQGVTESEAVTLMNDFISIDAEISAQITAEENSLSPADIVEAKSIILNPARWTPKSPITAQMLDSWFAHLETQIDSAKTRDRLKSSLKRLSKYLEQKGAELNFDTIHSFLSTLPAARQTRSNYLWAGRTFWKWANKYNVAFREKFNNQPCPFDGHELPRAGEAAGRKRLAYTKEQIEQLHDQALEKGSVALTHLIRFGAYTGARLEEIGRIRPEHTLFDDNGEPIGFKITESKTDAGIRDIPLHPNLVPLYKELCSKAKDNEGYLFPGGNNKYGNRLDGLSKKFGRLKSKSFNKDYTFHSIRHSVTTSLHQKGVSIEILPYILGHETGTFTLAQYSKGPSFEQKKDAISKLDYDFDN